MSSVFNNPYKDTKVWSTQGSKLLWSVDGNAAALPLAINSFQLTYQRPAMESFGLNTSENGNLTKYIYFSPASGTATMNGLFGPGTLVQKFLNQAGDPCKTITLTLEPQGTVCGSSGLSSTDICSITLTGVYLFSLSLMLSKARSAMTEVTMPLKFSFTGLQWKDGTSTSGGGTGSGARLPSGGILLA